MNYKKVLTGVLAASICFSSTGYLNTGSLTCINADEITDQVNQADNKEPDYTFCYKVSVTEEGMLGESISYALYSNGVLKISGTGRMNNFEESPFSAPEKITAVLFDDQENCSVENIGDNTFRECVNLYGITIPQTVTDIGTYAFSGCKSITEITVPDSVTRVGEYAFKNCSGLKKAVLGKGLTKVGTSSAEFFMFSGCYELEELSMPSLKTCDPQILDGNGATIGYKTDHDIGQVRQLFIETFNPGFLNNIHMYNFKKIIITSGDEIYPYEFSNMDVEEIILPDTITKISDYGFSYCEYLKEITLPEALTYIGKEAFYNCSLLKKIVMGKQIKKIGDNAFTWCKNTPEVFFNGTENEWNDLPCTPFVTDEQLYFLQSDKNEPDNKDITDHHSAEEILEKGTLGNNIDYILYGNGVLKIGGTGKMNDFEESPFKNKEKISSVIFDSSYDCSVENIGSNVFNSCTNITQISIPDSVISIEKKAFWDCESLSEITVPDSVNHIGESAFEKCSSMRKAVLGKGLVSISPDSVEFNIFKDCLKLEELSLPSLVSSPDSYIIDDNGKKTKGPKGGQIFKLFEADCSFFCDGALDVYLIPNYNLRKITVTSGTEIYPYEFINLNINEIILPDTITKISEYSFSNCELLKEIKLPDSVVEIGPNVFDHCDLLRTIYMGSKLKSVDSDAFGFYLGTPDILYSGSEEQWDELVSSSRCSDLSDAFVHFTSENKFVKTIGTDTTSPEILEQNRGSGDVDGDGITDLIDLVCLSMYLLRDYDLTTGAKVYSDITKDGEVDIADLPALKMIIMKA